MQAHVSTLSAPQPVWSNPQSTPDINHHQVTPLMALYSLVPGLITRCLLQERMYGQVTTVKDTPT